MAKGQEQAAPDAVLTRIGQVAMLHHAGDVRRPGPGSSASGRRSASTATRCTAAPWPTTSRTPRTTRATNWPGTCGPCRPPRNWRGRAPGTGEGGGDEPAAARALYPSLHLNLAADYDRLGHREAARLHLRRARRAAAFLAADRYGDRVRAQIDRLARRLADTGPDGEAGPATEGPDRPDGWWGPPRQRP